MESPTMGSGYDETGFLQFLCFFAFVSAILLVKTNLHQFCVNIYQWLGVLLCQ